MNPAMIIIILLVAIVLWFILARKDVFVKTEDFINESIEMGIHNNEEPIDVEFHTAKEK